MRNNDEIHRRLDELLARRLRELSTEYLTQTPRNCAFNTRFRVKKQGQVGFCQNPLVREAFGGKVFVCHERETAQQCKVFRCRNTSESVREEFDAIIRSPERCGEKFPKLAVLIWVVQEYTIRTRRGRLWRGVRNFWSSLTGLAFFKWW